MNSEVSIGKSRKLEILLVEDNISDVVLTQKTFKKTMFPNHVTVAQDGPKALAILRKEKEYADFPTPDIVLLDLNLPQMSGQDVLKEIRSDEKLKHIPVVVLTSSRAETDVAQTYDLHANSYLVKPVNIEKFIDLVRTLAWNRTIQLHI